jgi:hypothetical protein
MKRLHYTNLHVLMQTVMSIKVEEEKMILDEEKMILDPLHLANGQQLTQKYERSNKVINNLTDSH